jgi:hypothetical protein|tara:strand:+ start:1349 stop:1492 length:144 start_codon:yes stop_codon:yes gene_type:complete
MGNHLEEYISGYHKADSEEGKLDSFPKGLSEQEGKPFLPLTQDRKIK